MHKGEYLTGDFQTFTRLTGRKTLKRSDINEIKLLGFDIEILPTVSDLRTGAI